jgi:hypothetical protein
MDIQLQGILVSKMRIPELRKLLCEDEDGGGERQKRLREPCQAGVVPLSIVYTFGYPNIDSSISFYTLFMFAHGAG